jgi:DNA modification methylase
MYAGRDGAAGLKDFPGKIIAAFESEGWTYHSRVTIWKCPVIEMQRTKNHGLLYKQLRKNSAASRQGMADYVVTFRKWAEGMDENPVHHTHEEFPLDRWQKWASPVWDDIQQTRVLRYTNAKAADDERHICPLQLDVIERCVELWSKPGDLVFSPFAGIGSEGSESVRLGRRFLGIELKRSYWEMAVKNLNDAQSQSNQLGLLL